jgi:hypothetical protein
MSLSGVQVRTRLDSRQKHAAMTDFDWYLSKRSKLRESIHRV